MPKVFNRNRKKAIASSDQVEGGIKRKFSRYLLYALGEILLVVEGILIAIQIDAWNQRGVQEEIADQLLVNLKSDLENDLVALDFITSSTQRRMTEIKSIFQILKSPKIGDETEFINYNLSIPYFDLFIMNSGSFDESLSAASINYIKNDSLRIEIFNHYKMHKNFGPDQSYNKLLNEVIIPEWGEIVIPHSEALNYLGLDNNLESIDLSSLSKNKQYNKILAQKYGGQQIQIENWKKIESKTKELITRINRELE